MSISDLILQAKAKKAQSILFVVGSAPQIQQAGDWGVLRESPMLPSEWNILLQSVLNDQQCSLLEGHGSVVGEGRFGGARVGFSFYQSNETMKAFLNLDLEVDSVESTLPPIVAETALHKKGLILLAGQQERSLTTTLYEILSKMNTSKTFSALIFSQRSFPKLREDRGLFLYQQNADIKKVLNEGLDAGVDVVVFHGYGTEESFLLALQLAENGKLVIYDMIAPSVFNVIRRCYGFLEKSFGKHGAPRFAEVLELALGQMSMKGLSQDLVSVYEVMLVKPEVRLLIESEKLADLEKLLAQATEKSGLINFNQSLLQNLVRRKIDIKTAFEYSRDPDALDQLLKKVGI